MSAALLAAAALLVPIPREPLVPLVCFWSACMHPFVTALLGMSSLSQVEPLSLVSRLSLSVCYSTRPPRAPVAHHATGEPTPRSPLSCGGRHRTPTPTLLAVAGVRAAPATVQTQQFVNYALQSMSQDAGPDVQDEQSRPQHAAKIDDQPNRGWRPVRHAYMQPRLLREFIRFSECVGS